MGALFLSEGVADVARTAGEKGKAALAKGKEVAAKLDPAKHAEGLRNAIHDFYRKDEGKLVNNVGDLSQIIKRYALIAGFYAINPVLGLVAWWVDHVLKEKVTLQQKEEVLHKMTAELEVTEEKIKDAASSGNNEEKYKLMKLRAELSRAVAQLRSLPVAEENVLKKPANESLQAVFLLAEAVPDAVPEADFSTDDSTEKDAGVKADDNRKKKNRVRNLSDIMKYSPPEETVDPEKVGQTEDNAEEDETQDDSEGEEGNDDSEGEEGSDDSQEDVGEGDDSGAEEPEEDPTKAQEETYEARKKWKLYRQYEGLTASCQQLQDTLEGLDVTGFTPREAALYDSMCKTVDGCLEDVGIVMKVHFDSLPYEKLLSIYICFRTSTVTVANLLASLSGEPTIK